MDLTDEELEPAARALYEHAAPGVGPYGERKDWGDEDWKPEVRQSWFDGARAVAEALPQPVVDREAVEVEVCKVIADFFRDDESFTSYHATSLTARLLPLLGSRPQTGVVHVQHADAEEYARIFNVGFAEAVEQYNDSPLPTREEIAQAYFGHAQKNDLVPHDWDRAPEWMKRKSYETADLFLALLTGSAK